MQTTNESYDAMKAKVDAHFKTLIQKSAKRESLQLDSQTKFDQTSIADVFNRITKNHSDTLDLLREQLDCFVEEHILRSLEKALALLQSMHGQDVSIEDVIHGSLVD